MSWFDRARAAVALLTALGLAGCFQPLYGEATHPGLTDDLKTVEVAPIKERIGHYLGDDLISALNGTGETPIAKYRLVVTVAQNSQTPTVSSQMNAANAATVIGRANFTLTKIDGGKVLFKGDAIASAVYDRSLDNFANVRAARDAEIRLARALSEEIQVRVAAALANQS